MKPKRYVAIITIAFVIALGVAVPKFGLFNSLIHIELPNLTVNSNVNIPINVNSPTNSTTNTKLPEPMMPISPVTSSNLVIGEGRINCKETRSQRECEQLAELTAKGVLVKRVKELIITHIKMVNGRIEEDRIETMSQGILKQSIELFKGYEGNHYIYRLQSEVENLN